jgi:type III secretion system PrgH/EprH family protein
MPLSFEAENPEVRAVFRLLNGPLRGCEYGLADGTTLVVVGAQNELLSGTAMPEFPHNAIVVPLAEGGVNFEIVIGGDVCDGFRLRILDHPVREQAHACQEICHAGARRFAWRPVGVAWARGIADAEPAGDGARRRSPAMVRRVLAGTLAMFVVLGLGLTLWMSLKENKRVAEVAAVIAGSSQQYRLATGRDGAVYVFAESERDVSWARQALTRKGLGGAARVSTLRSEEARLNKLLPENYPAVAYHRLILADPARPVLMLSRERAALDEQAQRTLTDRMNQWMPYMQSVAIVYWSDALLDREAGAGLDRLGIPYLRSGNADSVTYEIQGSLNDVDRSRLQDFTDGFYRDFGSRYVSFSIELKDDWLKGKSFKSGSHGYVKMAPQHWFFPQSF